MSKILTAEDFISPKQKEIHDNMIKFSKGELTKEEADDVFSKIKIWNTEEGIKDLMIEFAKYHVEHVKEEMCKKFADQVGGREGWGNEIIMSVYPLDNIK